MKTVKEEAFGKTEDGVQTHRIILENDAGMKVVLLDLGAAVHSLVVPDKNARPTDVVLGYGHIGGYETGDTYFGASVGRCCNRIAKGRFTLNGKEYRLPCNDGGNHLHGGIRSFSRRVWDYEAVDGSVCFSLNGEDGEEGYPGNIKVRASFTLDEENRLTVCYRAQADADTVCNLTNHMYFNLDGFGSGDVCGHYLRLDADAYTETDAEGIPTGEILPVAGTAYDFRTGKTIGDGLREMGASAEKMEGFDDNYVLNHPGMDHISVCAKGGKSGICLECRTTQNGVQLYTANGTNVPEGEGKGGCGFGAWSGFCLETQNFPDAVNHGNFPSVLLKAGEVYCQTTEYRFL